MKLTFQEIISMLVIGAIAIFCLVYISNFTADCESKSGIVVKGLWGPECIEGKVLK